MRSAESARGAGIRVFSQVRGVEGERGWRRKAQVVGVFGGSGGCRERRAVATPRCVGEVRRGAGWLTCGAMRVRGKRYDAPGLGVQRGLRTGLREGSGAGVRVVLEYVEKGVPSRPYASVCPTEIEGFGNLTGDLTAVLTVRLTGYLKVALTKRRVRDGAGVEQRGSGHGLEAVAALGLGSLQDFRDD